jgi:prevent-host-death family protein
MILRLIPGGALPFLSIVLSLEQIDRTLTEVNGLVEGHPEDGRHFNLDDVTIHDHNQVMNKVGIADLKAHLSQHLRRVRSGRTLTVVDRDTPVAQIIPFDTEAPLEVRRATRKAKDLRLPPPLSKATNGLSVLLEDRASR